MGRGKVQLKRIENPTNRQVTFSKRRNGLIKKAFEISILCDAEVALLIFSPTGKAYQFASHDMDMTISKYRTEVGLSGPNFPRSRSVEVCREIEELRSSIDYTEQRLKHLAGEDISRLSVKDLEQLERQLKTGVERIRSKKRRMVLDHANLLKRKNRSLQEDNTRLQKRLVELQDSSISSKMLAPDSCIRSHQRSAFQGENCH